MGFINYLEILVYPKSFLYNAVLNEKVVHHLNLPVFCFYCHNNFK